EKCAVMDRKRPAACLRQPCRSRLPGDGAGHDPRRADQGCRAPDLRTAGWGLELDRDVGAGDGPAPAQPVSLCVQAPCLRWRWARHHRTAVYIDDGPEQHTSPADGATHEPGRDARGDCARPRRLLAADAGVSRRTVAAWAAVMPQAAQMMVS